MQERIKKIEERIAMLPSGSIARKTINGRTYFYHRWNEQGKRKEKYVPATAVEGLKKEIEARRSLERELKELKRQLPPKHPEPAYSTIIRTGNELRTIAQTVRNYKKRECYGKLHAFIYGEQNDKVLILYGLRRTGKTTLIRQILFEMSDEDIEKTAFIQVTARDSLARINHDMKILAQSGFRYIFLDEVTLMEDFIEGAALFSDIFAASGMKIILSGTDSLGFLFAEDEQLIIPSMLALVPVSVV